MPSILTIETNTTIVPMDNHCSLSFPTGELLDLHELSSAKKINSRMPHEQLKKIFPCRKNQTDHSPWLPSHRTKLWESSLSIKLHVSEKEKKRNIIARNDGKMKRQNNDRLCSGENIVWKNYKDMLRANKSTARINRWIYHIFILLFIVLMYSRI